MASQYEGVTLLGIVLALFFAVMTYPRKGDGPLIYSDERPLAVDKSYDGYSWIEKRYYSDRRGLEIRTFNGDRSERKFMWVMDCGRACEMTDPMIE